MKYSTALHLALVTGWAAEKNLAFQPLFARRYHRHSNHHSRNRQQEQQEHPDDPHRSSIVALHAVESSSSSSPHPPDKPPPADVLNQQEAYFASPATMTDGGVDEQDQDEEEGFDISVPYDATVQLAYEAYEASENQSTSMPYEEFKTMYLQQAVEEVKGKQQQRRSGGEAPQATTMATTATTTAPPPVVPAKPFMTEEQKVDINAAASRFFEEVWTPLTEVQPGVPGDTIKGAALAGATLAFLASKGLVVTSAAGLSAAYVAISQGVAGDVFRTVGGIAWDVSNTVTKLLQMATTNEKMRGLSKELASQVVTAVEESTNRAAALQELEEVMAASAAASGASTGRANGEYDEDDSIIKDATEAFLESQDELARVLREAESAIGAADAAIAQADETLDLEELYDGVSMDTPIVMDKEEEIEPAEEEETVDISIPYDATVQLAYESSSDNLSMDYEEFKAVYLAKAVAEVIAKRPVDVSVPYDATVQLAYQASDRSMPYAEFKTMYLTNAAEAVKVQRAKKAEAEAMRLAAEVEALRKKQEEEEAEAEVLRLATEAEALRKEEEAEAMRLAAEAEALRRKEEADGIRLAAEVEARQKEEEAEAMRFAAEVEARRKLEEEAQEASRLQEELRQAQEAVRMAEKDLVVEDEDGDELDDDDEWLAAVAMAQQGMEGTIVGLDEAIQDDGVKATWDAAGALAQELQGAAVDEDDDDDDLEMDMDMEALGRAARAAVERYEAELATEDVEVVEELGQAARAAVERYETLVATEDIDVAEEDDDDDDFEDLLPDGNLEDLAAAARQAVEAFGADEDYEEEEVDEEPFRGIDGIVVASSSSSGSPTSPRQQTFERDWSSLTVAKLKDELRFRGLKAYGKKTELIAMLEAYDHDQEKSAASGDDDDDGEEDDFMNYSSFSSAKFNNNKNSKANVVGDDDFDDDDDDFDLGDIDLEELGRQARAAVELGAMRDFDAEEPSDEVLMQLESEESILLDPSTLDDYVEEGEMMEVGSRESSGAVVDYESMTVLELKDELRDRGLRVSGKKSELVERLQDAEKNS